jgi:hypothetical protein
MYEAEVNCAIEVKRRTKLHILRSKCERFVNAEQLAS